MPEGFHTILSSSLSLSLFFGAFPFRRVEGRTYVFSWKLLSYSLLLGIASSAQGYVWAYGAIRDTALSMTLLLDILMGVGLACTWTVVLLQCFLKRQDLTAIVSQLDETHGRIGMVNYGKVYLFSMGAMSVINMIPKVYLIFLEPFNWLSPIKILLYYSFTNMPLVVAAQYAVLMNFVSDQLSSLTKKITLSKYNVEALDLVNIHQSLCMLSIRLNRTYDLFLLQVLTFPFAAVIVKMYILIVSITKPGVYADRERIFPVFMELIINASKIVVVVTAAMRATNSAKGFNWQLYDSMMDNKTFCQNKRLRIYISMNYGIKQTAYGFFSLNYHLLSSMIAATITNVLLLVQLTLIQ